MIIHKIEIGEKQTRLSLKQYESTPCLLVIFNNTTNKVKLDSVVERTPDIYIYGSRRSIKMLFDGVEWTVL